MGRAYEVRKASIQKNGAAKAKIYSQFAKEIYKAAKDGGTNPDSNYSLKRLIERAKIEQVPSDIVKRAIEKVESGVLDDYQEYIYEIFYKDGVTLVVLALTDNVNRTISSIKTILNKHKLKMGAQGSALYMYDHLAVMRTDIIDQEKLLEKAVEKDVELEDIEEDEYTTIYASPTDLFKLKEIVTEINSETTIYEEDIHYLPKDKIDLDEESIELLNIVIDALLNDDDISKVYHNANI